MSKYKTRAGGDHMKPPNNNYAPPNQDTEVDETDRILVRVQLGGTWIDKYPKQMVKQQEHPDIVEAKSALNQLIQERERLAYEKGWIAGKDKAMDAVEALSGRGRGTNEIIGSSTSGVGFMGKYLIIQGRKHIWDAKTGVYSWSKPRPAPISESKEQP